jgi:hypothetical protein
MANAERQGPDRNQTAQSDDAQSHWWEKWRPILEQCPISYSYVNNKKGIEVAARRVPYFPQLFNSLGLLTGEKHPLGNKTNFPAPANRLLGPSWEDAR